MASLRHNGKSRRIHMRYIMRCPLNLIRFYLSFLSMHLISICIVLAIISVFFQVTWNMTCKPYLFYRNMKSMADAHPRLKLSVSPSFVPVFGDLLRLKNAIDQEIPLNAIQEETNKGTRARVVLFGTYPRVELLDPDLIQTFLSPKMAENLQDR